MDKFTTIEEAERYLKKEVNSSATGTDKFMARCFPIIMRLNEQIAKKKVVQINKILSPESLGINKIIVDAKNEINKLQDSTILLDNVDKMKLEIYYSTVKLWRMLQEIEVFTKEHNGGSKLQ